MVFPLPSGLPSNCADYADFSFSPAVPLFADAASISLYATTRPWIGTMRSTSMLRRRMLTSLRRFEQSRSCFVAGYTPDTIAIDGRNRALLHAELGGSAATRTTSSYIAAAVKSKSRVAHERSHRAARRVLFRANTPSHWGNRKDVVHRSSAPHCALTTQCHLGGSMPEAGIGQRFSASDTTARRDQKFAGSEKFSAAC